MYEINLYNNFSIDLMIYAIGMLFSLIFLIIIFISKKFHNHYTSDNLLGPQKIHNSSTPRIGGLIIIISIFIQTLFILDKDKYVMMIILACSLPVFLAGFLEDITKIIKPLVRLLLTILSSLLITIFLDIEILNTGIDFFDKYIMVGTIPLFLTILSIVLLTQSFNIIDGLDGLALGTLMLIIFSLLYLSYLYRDLMVFELTLILFSSSLFLFIINFLTGKIFLGDGGAYLIGYLSAILLILISSRNSEISPFAILLIIIFPIYETIRSFIRRFFSKELKSFDPDNRHMHSLLYIYTKNNNFLKNKYANKLSSCLVLIFPISSVSLAITFHDTQNILIFCIFN